MNCHLNSILLLTFHGHCAAHNLPLANMLVSHAIPLGKPEGSLAPLHEWYVRSAKCATKASIMTFLGVGSIKLLENVLWTKNSSPPLLLGTFSLKEKGDS